MRKLAIIIFAFAFTFGALSLGYGQSAKVDFTGEWQSTKRAARDSHPALTRR